ncbi:MAG: DUF3159 domain-containing protein [Actinomycetales bacterium]|nr:DUF3159 domain-containing protein [Actinomycetales bacterium]
MTEADEPAERADRPDEQDEEFETPADVRQEALILERAIGGWRGIIDSGVPTGVFVIAYIITSGTLMPSLVAAIVAGALIAVWRLIRRESLMQIAAGFVGLVFSAWFASRTQNASDVYLPGMLTNLGYGTAFLISILVRWPLIGVAMGFLTGDGTTWRQDPQLRRVYAAASWIWVGLFYSRLVIQTPMYLAGWVEVQGIVKIIMGYPLFLASAYFTYLVLRPVFERKRREREAK